jgi:cbb3-type cytochrome oxidase subunit 1
VYRAAHLHVLLLGFVTMMIYGVAYHVIPRFAGFALHSRRAAAAHWWVSNVGLFVLAIGFVVRVGQPVFGTALVAAGGTLSAAGAYTFAYVLWRTMDGPSSLRAAAERAQLAQSGAARTLPVAPEVGNAQHSRASPGNAR